MSELFRVGSTWTHRNTGMVVYIKTIGHGTEEDPGDRFLLGSRDYDRFADGFILRDWWTASEMIREFELEDPNQEVTAWDHILHGNEF